MEDLMLVLGEELHRARRRAKLTIRQLKDKTGVSTTIISLVETGKRPQVAFDTVAKLASELGLSLDYVLSKAQEDNAQAA